MEAGASTRICATMESCAATTAASSCGWCEASPSRGKEGAFCCRLQMTLDSPSSTPQGGCRKDREPRPTTGSTFRALFKAGHSLLKSSLQNWPHSLKVKAPTAPWPWELL